MKRIISLLLALCCLCGTTALADNTTLDSTKTQGSTTVSYTVAASYEYTVTIPSSVNLTNGSQQMVIRISAPNYTATDKQIVVKMNADSYEDSYFSMANGISKIRYQIKYAGNGGATISPDTWSLTYYKDGPSSVGRSAFLTASVVEDDLTNATVGTYTDTLNFTVSLEDVN